MKKRRSRRLGKLLSLPVLAVCGFAIAATLASVGLAHDTSTTTTSSSTTSTSTSTSTSTTTTTTTTTTPRGEGCTPGFWKNHPEVWVGFATGQTVGSVFTGFSSALSSLTLLQGLSTGGGGEIALMRHAIAALLNAAHPSVDYPLTTAAIIAMVNAALASGDDDEIESLKDMLDRANNAHAPGFCD